MPGTTPLGIPYPIGTDRVMDGDNAIQSLATWVDSSLAFAAGYSIANGPGVGASMWIPINNGITSGGFAFAGTFPQSGFKVPRKGYYEIRAFANFQAGSVGVPTASRLFVGDGASTRWAWADCQYVNANAFHFVSLQHVRQLAANTVVYWGMQNFGSQGGGMIDGSDGSNHLVVRLLLPLA